MTRWQMCIRDRFYALRLVLDHAFAPVDAGGLGLARVRADADVANTASVRTMLRLGMTYVGMTREERPDTRPGFAGERVDMCQFEVLAGDDRDVVGEFNRRGWTPPKAVWCEDVQLREFAESDAPAVARFMRHPDFGPEHRPEASEADARRWIIRGLAGNYRRFTLRWAICPEQPVAGFAPGEPVGYIRAFALDGRHYSGDAEIGTRCIRTPADGGWERRPHGRWSATCSLPPSGAGTACAGSRRSPPPKTSPPRRCWRRRG